jgi:hypothetical protein
MLDKRKGASQRDAPSWAVLPDSIGTRRRFARSSIHGVLANVTQAVTLVEYCDVTGMARARVPGKNYCWLSRPT